ncbi:MAG: hypothetical protein R3C14_54820 [Caldilineaceae bacterium]
MSQLRYLLAAMVGWFFFLYNIERLISPINLASFVYVFAALCAVLLFLSIRLSQMPLQWLLLMVLPPFFLLKQYLGTETMGAHLPITVTELSAIALTIFLAKQTSQKLEEWHTTLSNLVIRRGKYEAQPFDTGQAEIYREVRRARKYGRPLALLAISVPDALSTASSGTLSQQLPDNRFIKEIESELVKKYILARVADLLIEALDDSAIITQRNSHFVALLPEMADAQLEQTIHELQVASQEKLGVSLKIGTSTFPEEAVTFEKMLEHAEQAMASTPTPHNGHHQSLIFSA